MMLQGGAEACGLGGGGSKAEPVPMIRLRVGSMRDTRDGLWLLYIRSLLPAAFYKRVTVQ
jgi:hypothetical protein